MVEEDIQRKKNSIDKIMKHSVLEIHNYFRIATEESPK